VNDDAVNIKTMIAAGFAALRAGEPQSARDTFTRAVATRKADASAWYGLALVQRRIGTPAEESAALDQALRLDSRFVPALIAKGDMHARAGDLPAATSYYQATLKLAASQQSLPPDLRAELQRIEAVCQAFAREYEAHVLAAIANSGANKPGMERFNRALDLLLGKRQIYLQQPKYFYFPELPQVQFYERQSFSWVQSLEQKTDAIRAELGAILATGAGFEPYVQSETDRPNFDPRGLLNNSDWSACYLIRSGVEERETAARCPITMAALRDVPMCRMEGRTPSVLFSLLRPGAHIPPHHGFTNVRLICHLPLIVPGKCALRVGNETREWRERELLIFDDSIEHEAWNSSNELRVILLFDIWRPELSQDERTLVTALLQSVDTFGKRREWVD
jgi:aspartyl/asparaginyl beta-hydroxylase (cupin superfamily)/Tfp pilus assembly protein PilF